jgi:hypothetical protein
VSAEDAADGLRVAALHLGDVEAELEAGTTPGHPDDAVAEALLGEGLAVRGRGEGDAAVRVQVVDVGALHQAVHGGVDARGGAALPVQAEVERGDHLVLALDARVDVDERSDPVQAQDGESRLGEGPEVTARALHPEQLDGLTGDRVLLRALGGGVAAGVVGVAGVGAQAVAAGDEVVGGTGHGIGSRKGVTSTDG